MKKPPSLREFFADCPKCGTYRIGEKTARKFLTAALREKLDESLARGATGAKLSFRGGCPVCESDRTHELVLSALTARIH